MGMIGAMGNVCYYCAGDKAAWKAAISVNGYCNVQPCASCDLINNHMISRTFTF